MSDKPEEVLFPKLKDIDGALGLMAIMGSESKCQKLLEEVKSTLAKNGQIVNEASRRLQAICDIEKKLENLKKREKTADAAIAELARIKDAFNNAVVS